MQPNANFYDMWIRFVFLITFISTGVSANTVIIDHNAYAELRSNTISALQLKHPFEAIQLSKALVRIDDSFVNKMLYLNSLLMGQDISKALEVISDFNLSELTIEQQDVVKDIQNRIEASQLQNHTIVNIQYINNPSDLPESQTFQVNGVNMTYQRPPDYKDDGVGYAFTEIISLHYSSSLNGSLSLTISPDDSAYGKYQSASVDWIYTQRSDRWPLITASKLSMNQINNNSSKEIKIGFSVPDEIVPSNRTLMPFLNVTSSSDETKKDIDLGIAFYHPNRINSFISFDKSWRTNQPFKELRIGADFALTSKLFSRLDFEVGHKDYLEDDALFGKARSDKAFKATITKYMHFMNWQINPQISVFNTNSNINLYDRSGVTFGLSLIF